MKLPATPPHMTVRDVLISRVHDALGSPRHALSSHAHHREEELWAVTAEGKQSMTVHPFSEALDVALTWAAELDGQIYRRDQPGGDPGLYKAAW